MRRKNFHYRVALFVGLACWSAAPAQTPPPGVHSRPNGISVGQPKIFDNRSLTLMLENLSDTLRSMQTQFVSPADVAKALSNLSGFRSSETVSNLSVTGPSVPGVKQEVVATTGNATTDGKTLLPDTTKTTTTTNRDAVVPSAPSLDTVPDLKGFSPNYGPNASDLLSDQINLTYQILNLRMILDRSLSDRLLDGVDGGTRLQAVMGFNVTIDPPRTANDAVAVVEVTVEPESAAPDGGLSMIALMPQEKTYNAATLSSKSRQFGGSAVVKLMQVGYTERRRGQIFYLYRDTDTLSYERMIGGHTLQFGWMFRPVLGRRSVSPGLRQMFAVIALPVEDSGKVPYKLKATVRTYWKKYDAGTMTSYLHDDANRARKAAFVSTLGLTHPQIFGPDWMDTAVYPGIQVKPTGEYQSALRPVLTDAWWRPIGPKAASVTLQGKNLFTGTQVLLGDKTLSGPADGLVLKSNETAEVVTTIEALASGPGVVSGRYGGSIPVVVPDPKGVAPNGVAINDMRLGPSIGGVRRLEVFLIARDSGGATGSGQSLRLSQLPLETFAQVRVPANPILTLNGHLVEMPYAVREQGNRVVIEANLRDSALENGTGILKVSWPFLSTERWTATKRVFLCDTPFEVTRLGAKSIFISKHDSLSFAQDPESEDLQPRPAGTRAFCWQVASGDERAKKLQSATCTGVSGPIDPTPYGLSVTMDKDIGDKVILITPNGASCALTVPPAKKADPPGPIVVSQNDSVWVDVTVKGSTDKATVEANGISLPFRDKAAPAAAGTPASPAPDTKTIEVHVTREITAQAGQIDITVTGSDGKKIGSAKLSIVCVHCESQTRK